MKRNKRRQKKNRKCYFCENESTPDYKDTLIMRRFITDRGKIVPGSRSGVCSSHQRELTKAIKNARYMGLLYYTEKHAI
mgnify:CR=1 FL=1